MKCSENGNEPKIYGYIRVSTKKQNTDRQARNISEAFPGAIHYTDKFTGTKIEGRDAFKSLKKKVKPGDTIVFDSVSRMSRNADEGIKQYFEWYDNGITLVFLNESYINTEVYAKENADRIALTGDAIDEIAIGINNYFRRLAKKQIRLAFEQAEKEAADIKKRVAEGIREAKIANESLPDEKKKRIGRQQGETIETRKSKEAKELIKKYSRDFNGKNNDAETMTLLAGSDLKISRGSYYKYKKQLLEEAKNK